MTGRQQYRYNPDCYCPWCQAGGNHPAPHLAGTDHPYDGYDEPHNPPT